MGPDAEGEITEHIIMVKTKTEKKHLAEGPKSPKKKRSVTDPFYFVEKTTSKYRKKENSKKHSNHDERRKKYYKNGHREICNGKFISEQISQTERKTTREPELNTSGEIFQKNGTAYAD